MGNEVGVLDEVRSSINIDCIHFDFFIEDFVSTVR